MRRWFKCRSGEQWSANCPEAAKPKLSVILSPPEPFPLPPPDGLDETGAALWCDLVGTFEWDDPTAYRALLEACFAIQRAARCRKLIDEQGEVPKTKAGLSSPPPLRDETAAERWAVVCWRDLARILSRSGRLAGRRAGFPHADETSGSAAADRRRRAPVGSGLVDRGEEPPTNSEAEVAYVGMAVLRPSRSRFAAVRIARKAGRSGPGSSASAAADVPTKRTRRTPRAHGLRAAAISAWKWR